MYIYVVTYNDKVSSEGYKTVEDAIKFIKNKGYNLLQLSDWWYEDSKGNTYKIHDVRVK